MIIYIINGARENCTKKIRVKRKRKFEIENSLNISEVQKSSEIDTNSKCHQKCDILSKI